MITGAAGFIGFHVAKNLLAKKKKLILIDNLNKYYDQNLKKKRIKELKKIDKKIIFRKLDISNHKKLSQIFSSYKIDKVLNLAAQAGVRYSIKKPGDQYRRAEPAGSGCYWADLQKLIPAFHCLPLGRTAQESWLMAEPEPQP